MKTKLGAVLVILALMLSVLPMTAVSANAAGPSWVWGTDPASADEELVLLDAWTGTEYARFALPGDPSGDMELALAGESAQLYYVNGDDDDFTVYLLDPTDGSTLGTVTLTGGWDVDGIGNYGGGGGYLYTSGCPLLDMHRYPAAGGSPTFFWSTIYDPLAVGGDDTGRIYSTDYVEEQYVIAEVDPVNNVAPLNTFASPTQDIVGMAFDGTYLYVSDTNDMLYILDPDDGTVENSLDLGYTLYALAVTEVLPPALEVEKHYTYTNVCFERDNDLDGLFNEDPIDFDAGGDPIDNDGDGRFNEDPVDCPEGTELGTLLPMDAEDNYQLEAVVKKNGKVSSYNPGQYYAVSTVNVLFDVDVLTITEDWGGCEDISALNPKKGGGRVVIVEIRGDGEAYQILDANMEGVTVTATGATAVLEDVPAGTTILMYVKFGPGMKGEMWEGPYDPCVNTNTAGVSIGDWVSDEEGDSASLKLILKVTGD